ncbi:hypothetical protein ACFX2J_000578 [Malus domestica]
MSTYTATNMKWHKEKRVDDEVMRHPTDGEAWKEFNRTFPKFAADPRNVRLRLAIDGFNLSIDIYLRLLVDELKDL